MKKKHFMALANTIRYENKYGQSFTESQIKALADFCKSTNAQFNRKRWLYYIAGNCGKNGGKVKQTVNA